MNERKNLKEVQLKPWPQNERKPFLRILVELSQTDNPVTKSVRKSILKDRIDRGDY